MDFVLEWDGFLASLEEDPPHDWTVVVVGSDSMVGCYSCYYRTGLACDGLVQMVNRCGALARMMVVGCRGVVDIVVDNGHRMGCHRLVYRMQSCWRMAPGRK